MTQAETPLDKTPTPQAFDPSTSEEPHVRTVSTKSDYFHSTGDAREPMTTVGC